MPAEIIPVEPASHQAEGNVLMTIDKKQLANVLEKVREKEPLVQCFTNVVVTNFTANTLLAAGASAAMADLPGEAGFFSSIANGVLINLGTPYKEQREGILEVVEALSKNNTPWVLDPVAVGALEVRTELAKKILPYSPTVIRGNASEIGFCAGATAGGRGVDATSSVSEVVEAASALAKNSGSVIAISGPTDTTIAPDGRRVNLSNGSPLLTKVTGGGCALGALISACCGVEEDYFLATNTAIAWWTVAADIAAESSSGPASFAVNLIDNVYNLTSDELVERIVLS